MENVSRETFVLFSPVFHVKHRGWKWNSMISEHYEFRRYYSHLKKRTAIAVHTAAHTTMITTGTIA